MGDITTNISKHELRCKCSDDKCHFTILPSEPVIKMVQECCDFFSTKYNRGRPVILKINSAARCVNHNRNIGSTDNSQHARARAMDIEVWTTPADKIKSEVLYEYFDERYPTRLGLGCYESFFHIDTRPDCARWHG